jgi:hypothetical protein
MRRSGDGGGATRALAAVAKSLRRDVSGAVGKARARPVSRAVCIARSS